MDYTSIMGRKIKVSVILPSLNVENYIRECIESVVNQSLQEIEIICVDAGSTDGTLEIIKNYAAKDYRIKVIVSDKKSYGYQMNLGISAAQGEYIGIVETDDFIPREMYEELYFIAKENKLEIIKADFYNFTGTGNELKKEKISLTAEKKLYNRVVNIENEQKCLLFPINTWTGVYSRKYLQEHHICHNETPGSSFQDNGFGFLVFVYAKRVMFLNKPYYMHRKDNPSSSINNKGKVFCICNEFKFIRNELKKNEEIYQKFKYTYTRACYGAYFYHFKRIAHEYRKAFLERFALDFRAFQERGELDDRFLKEAPFLLSIMESPEDFYITHVLPKKKIHDALYKHENIIIYGAGKIGIKTFHELADCGLLKKILCFAVSEKAGNLTEYEGISICEIYNLQEYRENSLIVIATTQNYQAQIYRTLETLRFKYIISITELKKI